MKSALNTTHYRAGFTLVEIMTVAAILVLLAAIAIPSYQRSRKRAQASRVLEDLRILDYAIAQYALEYGKVPGESVTIAQTKIYLKPASLIYQTGRDCFGHEYGPTFAVDILPKVPALTHEALSDVTSPEYWAPYNP